MDRGLLFQFFNDTQLDEMEYLRKIYKTNLEETIVNFINTETTKDRGRLLNVLKHRIEISGKILPFSLFHKTMPLFFKIILFYIIAYIKRHLWGIYCPAFYMMYCVDKTTIGCLVLSVWTIWM